MLDFFLERSVYIYEKYFEIKFSYLINMGVLIFSKGILYTIVGL